MSNVNKVKNSFQNNFRLQSSSKMRAYSTFAGKKSPPPQNQNQNSHKKQFRTLSATAIIRRLINYIGKARFSVYAILVMLVLMTLLFAAKPIILGNVIDTLTQMYNKKTENYTHLYTMLFLLAGTSALASIIQYLQGLFSANLSKHIIYNLRSDVFNSLTHLPLSYLENHSHGDLMSRVVNDSENVATVISSSLASFFQSIISILTLTTIMVYISPLLTAIIYISVPLSVFLTKQLSKKMRYYFRLKHETLGTLEGNIEENIYGYETLLAYNQRERILDRFENVNIDYKNISIKSGILSNLINPLLTILSGAAYVAIIFVGAYLSINGKMTIGTIQTFLLYIRQLTQPLNSITNLYSQIQTAFASAERIFEILDASKEIDNGTENRQTLSGAFTIENVNFGYDENTPILENFSLRIEPSQKIGIVGETGSGKTSIINMLMRFYPYSSGSIKIDDVDIKDYSLECLRSNISLVPQDTFFYTDTIRNNLLYSSENKYANESKYSNDSKYVSNNKENEKKNENDNEHENERLNYAAKSANAYNFIMQLPEQYETPLTTEASNISVGQRQLLALTRAFIKNAPILILDEATANIDTLTEMQIQNAILSLMENRTCIVIAHRLSTIVNMDKIIVLSKGKIIEVGNHEELMQKKGHYYSLYMYQVEQH